MSNVLFLPYLIDEKAKPAQHIWHYEYACASADLYLPNALIVNSYQWLTFLLKRSQSLRYL